MQLTVTDVGCNGTNQLVVNQLQGENSPIVFNFPSDLTDFTFQGTINFPEAVTLAIGDGITVDNILSCTGSISGSTLTVTAIASGEIGVGTLVASQSIKPNTFITAVLTGSGGIGTYTVSQSQTVASGTIASSKVLLQLDSDQTQTVPEGQYPFELWTISGDVTPIEAPAVTGYFSITPTNTVIG